MRFSVIARIFFVAVLVGITGDNYMNMMCCAGSGFTGYVRKKILNNGLTVLVRSSHAIPKVCVEIWYKVGSKNEKTDQKGIAHLIEHMVFKGTTGQNSLNLSESDINVIVHTLSGSCNALLV
jgi:zinc protease